MADIPAEMVRREEEAAEEHKGLFGRLFDFGGAGDNACSIASIRSARWATISHSSVVMTE